MEIIKGNGLKPTGSLRYYICNVCARESRWTEEHGYIERPVKLFEEQFIICSNECRKVAREHFIKWLGSKEGWSIKKATLNFDETIKF
ncbi:MAG: hypothetical protein V4547_17670 [Bacteroidota bacterium]